MKKIFFLLFLFLIPSSLADVNINNTNFYIISNNVTINFSSNQTYTSISTASNQIVINGYGLALVPSSPINATINNYSTSSNFYNITFNGTDPLVQFYQAVPLGGNYQFVRNGAFLLFLATSGSTLTTTINSIGNTYVWFIDPSLSATLTLSKSQSCSNLNSYIIVVIPLFGLALMIFAFAIVLFQLKFSSHINSLLISTSIIVAIVGFGMLLVGNYLIYSIFSVTGC